MLHNKMIIAVGFLLVFGGKASGIPSTEHPKEGPPIHSAHRSRSVSADGSIHVETAEVPPAVLQNATSQTVMSTGSLQQKSSMTRKVSSSSPALPNTNPVSFDDLDSTLDGFEDKIRAWVDQRTQYFVLRGDLDSDLRRVGRDISQLSTRISSVAAGSNSACNYDVKLEVLGVVGSEDLTSAEARGAPSMYMNGAWYPICGQYNWNNDEAAKIFCRQLYGRDHLMGAAHQNRTALGEDGVFVRRCSANGGPDVADLEACDDAPPGRQLPRSGAVGADACLAGRRMKQEISCTFGLTWPDVRNMPVIGQIVSSRSGNCWHPSFAPSGNWW